VRISFSFLLKSEKWSCKHSHPEKEIRYWLERRLSFYIRAEKKGRTTKAWKYVYVRESAFFTYSSLFSEAQSFMGYVGGMAGFLSLPTRSTTALLFEGSRYSENTKLGAVR